MPPIRNEQAWEDYKAQIESLKQSDPIRKAPRDGNETHHIIPKCYIPKSKWNNKDNLIVVPAREHFHLHKLLSEAVGGKMTLAFNRMLTSKQNGFREDLTDEEYQTLREEANKIRSEFGHKNQKGKKNSFYGHKHTKESRKKMSESLKGSGNPNYGKPMLPHVKESIRKANTGNKYSVGRVASEETRRKLSESLKGRPAWNKGIHPSESSRKKMSASHTGRVYINNGKDNKSIKPEELKGYLKKGWKRGRTPNRKKRTDS